MLFAGIAVPAMIVWILTGLVISFVMGRRRHDASTWWLIGSALGPLAFVHVVDRIRRERKQAGRAPQHRGGLGRGTVDVLVGIDGSPEAEAAVAAVAEMLGPMIRRLTLATVLPYDTPTWSDARRGANQALALAALRALHVRHERTFLHGSPAGALIRHAREGGFGLAAVGRRGEGPSAALLGSVASTLARTGDVPVLIVGSTRSARRRFPLAGRASRNGTEAIAPTSSRATTSKQRGGERHVA
jgi:nucleotide-binding universal stress UspA family protein